MGRSSRLVLRSRGKCPEREWRVGVDERVEVDDDGGRAQALATGSEGREVRGERREG
jgi:hypothetical protein